MTTAQSVVPQPHRAVEITDKSKSGQTKTKAGLLAHTVFGFGLVACNVAFIPLSFNDRDG